MTLDVLTDPEAILKATRASAAYPSDREHAEALIPPSDFPPESHPVSVPPAIMRRSGRVGDYNYLEMPIDRRLERLARLMIAHPGDLLGLDAKVMKDSGRRFDEAQLRAEGAKALRYFKSDENIALLKPLLNDSTVTHVTKPIEGQTVERFREYFVRKEAVATLRCWGLDSDEIVVREPDTTP